MTGRHREARDEAMTCAPTPGLPARRLPGEVVT